MGALMATPYPPIPGRPLFIESGGGKIWILFHDHEHLVTRKKFLLGIRRVHPDTNGGKELSSKNKVRKLVEAYHVWQKKEIRWYGQLGLNPPASRILFRVPGRKPTAPKPEPLVQLKSRFPLPHWTRRSGARGPRKNWDHHYTPKKYWAPFVTAVSRYL